MNNKCKVLSPVGNINDLSSAVYSGADCVYLSGKKYGARGFADNFSHEQIEEAILFCHKNNVEVFVTINISILESEIIDVIDYVYFLYSQGVDAVIIQDIGLANIVRNLFPKLKIHASTQMTIYDYSFVKWLNDNNFDSANISREVPVGRIKNIVRKLRKYNHDIKVEIFGHGALCYCYSGECLMSSFLGGRSGNRGLCAQPCRMRYSILDKYHGQISDDDYYLSTKDLCTYNNVKQLVDSGVNCIKIEGRMKSSEYISTTTYCYKNAINNNINKEDNLLLNLAFNRGLTEGYILEDNNVVGRKQPGNNGFPIGVVSKANEKKITIKLKTKDYPIKLVNGDGLKFEYGGKTYGMYISRIFSQNKYKLIMSNEKNIYLNEGTLVYLTYSKYLHDKSKSIINEKHVNKIPINLIVNINNNRQLELKYTNTETEKTLIYTSDEKFEKANNKPLTKEKINNQLKKTGDSKFIIENIKYENFYDDLFMPISIINNIRRNFLKLIEKNLKQLHTPDRKELKIIKENCDNFKNKHFKNHQQHKVNNQKKKWNVYVNNLKQAKLLKEYNFIDCVYYDASFNYDNMHDYCRGIYDELTDLKNILPDNVKIVWILPRLLLDKDLSHISEILLKLEHDKVNFCVQTDNVGVAYNLNADCYANYLNVYNNYTIEKLSEDNLFKQVVISNEISLNDIKQLQANTCNLEYVVFGHVELMISKDDFKDVFVRDDNSYYLKDKRDHEFKLKFDCNNNSHIYDYRILNQEKYIDQLEKCDINSLTIDLRHFNIKDTKTILDYRENKVEKLELIENNLFFNGNIEKGLFMNNK